MAIRRDLAAWLVAFGLVLQGVEVSAQPAPETPSPAGKRGKPEGAAKVDAKALVQSGVKLLRQKDYLGALVVFRDAYQRFPSVKLLLNIGTTLKLLGRDAEAANAYQRYLDAPDADRARAVEVKAELAKLDRRVGVVQIVVADEAPVGAELSIVEGDWLPLRPGPLRVAPGPYRLRARAVGFEPVEISAVAVAGERQEQRLVLVAIPVVEEVPEAPPVIPDVEVTRPLPPPARERRSRLGLMLRGHFHLSPAGAAALIGPTLDVTRRVEVHAGVLIGRFRGGYAGSSVALTSTRIRPLVSGGAVLFVDDGPRVALRGAVGLELVLSRNLSLFAEVGGERLLNPPMTVFANSFVPSASVHGRL
ncbi:MAG: hypothetical protein R3B48_09650 [Kofleriaceae bacterium]